jgi:hypothetical protein
VVGVRSLTLSGVTFSFSFSLDIDIDIDIVFGDGRCGGHLTFSSRGLFGSPEVSDEFSVFWHIEWQHRDSHDFEGFRRC